jgi:hypothetical protein
MMLILKHSRKEVMAMSEPRPEDEARRPDVVRLTPELLEWARQLVTEEEVVASLRELRANGGIGSEELLAVLDGQTGPMSAVGAAPTVP